MEVYKDSFRCGKRVVMVGGGLVGCETGLHLQKTGHEVTVVEMLERVADESYGMYREALVWEMEKTNMSMLTKTKCLEIEKDGVVVENEAGIQKLPADTVIYALGMKTADYSSLKQAAGSADVWVIGDAVKPRKVDQAIRTGYLAAVEQTEESPKY
jgi:pyruvate/2-oxoglutarate dehydrogenase complex dihydrolipoamide dehydrogenase (E3) component